MERDFQKVTTHNAARSLLLSNQESFCSKTGACRLMQLLNCKRYWHSQGSFCCALVCQVCMVSACSINLGQRYCKDIPCKCCALSYIKRLRFCESSIKGTEKSFSFAKRPIHPILGVIFQIPNINIWTKITNVLMNVAKNDTYIL